VQKAINLFTKGREKDWFLKVYARSGKYRPAIVRELKEAGLPEELSWLPFIESGYSTVAISSARALGMWQFIASTGKHTAAWLMACPHLLPVTKVSTLSFIQDWCLPPCRYESWRSNINSH